MDYQAAGKDDVAALARVPDADLNRANENGTTLLMVAARRGNLESVRALLKRGADPRARDHDGQTVLHYALPSKNRALISELLRAGADPHVTDRFGVTPAEDDIVLDLLQAK